MKRIITISREFGSGGHSIGQKVAEKLNLSFYDQALLEKIAQETGLSKEYIENSEYAPARNSLLFNIVVNRSLTNYAEPSPADMVYFAQMKIIQEIAEKEPCVIVGRCSDYILGEDPACIKVFIHADMASRIDRCVAEYHIPSDNMESRIIQMDRGRANYYNYYTGHTWGEMRRYDLTLNSSITGINGAVEMIAQLVRLRSAQLDQAPTQAP